jgi:hypothetical protein
MVQSTRAIVVACAAIVAPPLAAHGAPVELRVTVRNLAPANSISFAPLRVGFGDGTFDSFDAGEAATAPIISIAEGGSGSDWFPAFAAAEPGATLGTVVGMPAGPLLPGASASTTFTVDPAMNRFFTFASMAVPSNDYFIGNDSPTQYELFDAMGQLNLTSITQSASDIWDAGSEADSIANAAFIVGSNNDLRIDQGGVVSFDFEGLSIFNGQTTAAGYTFDLQLTSSTPVYSISFEVVPAPGTLALLGLGALVSRRRR